MKKDKFYFGIFNSWDILEDEVFNDIRDGIAECNNLESNEVPDEWVYDSFWEYLNDEKSNLNIETGGYILAFASLGLWDGKHIGYKEIGTNVKEIFDFDGYDDYEWYADKYNVRATLYHHDGRNHVIFRYVESQEKLESLCEKIYDGRIKSERELFRSTKSIRPFVAKTYGWKEFGWQKRN